MKTKICLGINFLLIAAVIAYLVWNHQRRPRIAFVQSAVLVDKYVGMKEARAVFKNKLQHWQGQIDTLKRNYEHAAIAFSKAKGKDKERLLKEIAASRTELDGYVSKIENDSRREEEIIIQGALNQINQFISDYSKRESLQLVLGVNLSGNVLYGADYIDITDEVLAELNQNYTGR